MWRQLIILIMDVYLIAVATVTAGALRDNFELSWDRTVLLLPYLGWTVLSAFVVLPAMGISRSIWRFSGMTDYARTIPATIAIVIGAVALGFLFDRLHNVARALPVLQGILMIFLLVGARVTFRLYHASRRQKPKLLVVSPKGATQAVILVGANRIAELYLQSVQEFAIDRIHVVGLLGSSDRQTGRLLNNIPILGMPQDAIAVLQELDVRGIVVDRIVVTTRFDALPAEARATLLQIERTTEIKLEIFADFLLQPTILADDEPRDEPRGGTRWSRRPGGQSERVGLGARSHDQKAEHGAVERGESLAGAHGAFVIDDATLEAISRQPYWVVKRFLDFVAALTLLVLLAPLFVVVGLLVVVDVGWPVTFWQQRPGLGNFSFKLYKFRTMAAAYDSRGERIADDERLSAIGVFLRRTRLDELPQLLHILAGKMSFVGPRPLLPVDQSSDHAVRLLVRPGMTGWAQVKGGRAISAEDKAALDVWYVNKASLALDLKIILDTIPMILVGERVDEDAIRQAWQDLAAEGICPPASMPPAYQSVRTTSAGNPAP